MSGKKAEFEPTNMATLAHGKRRKLTREQRVEAAARWGRENAPDAVLEMELARTAHKQAYAALEVAQNTDGGLLPVDAEDLDGAKRECRSRAMALDMAERALIKEHEEDLRDMGFHITDDGWIEPQRKEGEDMGMNTDRMRKAERWAEKHEPNLLLAVREMQMEHKNMVWRRVQLEQQRKMCSVELFPEDMETIKGRIIGNCTELRELSERLDMAEDALIKAYGGWKT